MCAIIDNNVRDELVKEHPSAIGSYFRKWLSDRRGKLVVGGKLLEELRENRAVKLWLSSRIQAGVVDHIEDNKVNEVTDLIRDQCRSDDPHIIALARVSGARLLYTADRDLMDDFRNRELLGGRIQGKIYKASVEKDTLSSSHKSLLSRRDLCVPRR